MYLFHTIQVATCNYLNTRLGSLLGLDDIPVSWTKAEIKGDITITLFPLMKQFKKSPAELQALLTVPLLEIEFIDGIETTGGFLNIKCKPELWQKYVSDNSFLEVILPDLPQTIVMEFASPNTNKPLHLGHVRNVLLGNSMSNIIEKLGHRVYRVQVINDRGIAICKSMLMYQKLGEGKTPLELGIKGDHYVGELYVKFEDHFKIEYNSWQQSAAGKEVLANSNERGLSETSFFQSYKNTYFNQYSLLGKEAREMLIKWENGDAATRTLWVTMNSWVYEGFETTLNQLDIKFDKTYYESDTYLLGKEVINEGLAKGVFVRERDGSVWIDLTDQGLDRKLVLRSDGTSVYITQDIGTAIQRYEELHFDRMAYVVADEQNYHFDVLFKILKALGQPFAAGLHHLSYGMVELPEGKMKSREGTVVDADDLMREVITEAKDAGKDRGDLEMMSPEAQHEIYERIGMAALKYHMLKVQARKRMIFDPKESVDMQGQTGPYIQNAYVRIRSIERRAGVPGDGPLLDSSIIENQEITLVKNMLQYQTVLQEASREYDPSVIANFLYTLAKSFHRYYHDVPVLTATDPHIRSWRLRLISSVASVLEEGMKLLGVRMPERM